MAEKLGGNSPWCFYIVMQQKTSVCMWSVKNENLDGACSIHCSDALKNGNRKELGIRNGANVMSLLETCLEKKRIYMKMMK